MNQRIIIEIDEQQAEGLRTHYENVIASKLQHVQSLLEEIERDKKFVETLNTKLIGAPINSIKDVTPTTERKTTTAPTNLNGYDVKASWISKFKYILAKNNKVLSINNALDQIRTYEPIGSGMEPAYRKIQAQISANLKLMYDARKIKRIKSEAGQFVYGFNEWFNEDGTVKDEYK